MTQEAMPSFIGNWLLPLLRRPPDTWFDGTMVRVLGALIVAQLMVVAVEVEFAMATGLTLADAILQATGTQVLFDLAVHGL